MKHAQSHVWWVLTDNLANDHLFALFVQDVYFAQHLSASVPSFQLQKSIHDVCRRDKQLVLGGGQEVCQFSDHSGSQQILH